MDDLPAIADDVLDFWFAQDIVPKICEYRPIWFEFTDPAFDADITFRFSGLHERAAKGELQALAETVNGALALVLLLDQFPRHMFRRSARQYATDPLALALARRALDRGFDKTLAPIRRWFLFLPFTHSEQLAEQHRSVQLFQSLESEPVHRIVISSAQLHLDIIQRFGRFPHRNEALGRRTTDEVAIFFEGFCHRHLGSG